jgi:hypothetical protein
MRMWLYLWKACPHHPPHPISCHVVPFTGLDPHPTLRAFSHYAAAPLKITAGAERQGFPTRLLSTSPFFSSSWWCMRPMPTVGHCSPTGKAAAHHRWSRCRPFTNVTLSEWAPPSCTLPDTTPNPCSSHRWRPHPQLATAAPTASAPLCCPEHMRVWWPRSMRTSALAPWVGIGRWARTVVRGRGPNPAHALFHIFLFFSDFLTVKK